MDIIYDVSLAGSALPRRTSVFRTVTIFSIFLAISSLWFPFSNRDGGSGGYPSPVPRFINFICTFYERHPQLETN